jgi:alkanesulfonate monooxygenase SsuD/methylene tetrahydromethanopterin reductase-like flavin-dependent oxidoreductase (luciferase family)
LFAHLSSGTVDTVSDTAQTVDPLTVLALTRPLLAELLEPGHADRLSRIAGLLDESVDAVVLGADLVAPERAPGPSNTVGVDPTIAAITLAHLTTHVGLIVAAAPHRDHPYNLARRLASIDHASRGRVGLLIGSNDSIAPDGSPWTTSEPGDAAADAVTAIRELWRSFPIDAVVGDREAGLFAESHRIVAVDHRGAFNVTGPLQVPWGPQIWPPVLAWPGVAGPAALAADIVVTEHDSRFTLHWPTHLGDLGELFADHRSTVVHRGTTLRERLGLNAASPPTRGRAVFPDPAAQSPASRVSAS